MSVKVLVLILVFVPLSRCVVLDLIDCGIDHDLEVQVGDIELMQYPWLGVLYYVYYGDAGETRAVTSVVLIQKEFVLANAADIGPMPKIDFRRQSRVLLGEGWRAGAGGRRVRNYVLHPDYGETHNTAALVQLREPVLDLKIRPICPPPERLRNPVFYVVKFKEDYSNLKKEVIPVSHVPGQMCKDFYVIANLYSKKMRPPHVACAVALDMERPCVWEAGAALVARDIWGRWILLGLGVRGPGCGAPARFLDAASYFPWIRASLAKFQRITISKLSKQKYVLRSGGRGGGGGGGDDAVSGQGAEEGSVVQRFGACDPEEMVNLIYRELLLLETDNTQYQFITYNMTILENLEYSCLTLELVNATAVSEMRIKHYCPRESYGPACHAFKGSIFAISVYIMFSDKCRFEMYAWGYTKNMTLLDIQEWKWEEGTYYEDFSLTRSEYRGQKYMTEFGYEPLDEKMWVPDYDVWTSSQFDNSSWSSTTPVPDKDTDEENKEDVLGFSFQVADTPAPW